MRTRSSKIGIKYDVNKPDWALLPLGPVEDIVKVLTYGAKKYTPDNWKHVEPRRYQSALFRHLVAWFWNREWLDKESGLPHLAHAGCCLIFLLWFGEKG